MRHSTLATAAVASAETGLQAKSRSTFDVVTHGRDAVVKAQVGPLVTELRTGGATGDSPPIVSTFLKHPASETLSPAPKNSCLATFAIPEPSLFDS